MSAPSLLAQVVRATASATDSTTILDRVAALLTSCADWVIADRLDDPDLITRVAVYDASGAISLPSGMGSTSTRRSSAGSSGLLPDVLKGPQAFWHLRSDDLLAIASAPASHRSRQAAMALQLGAREVLLIPCTAGDRVVGVITLGSRSGFTAQDVSELADVALHLGLALDAARLLVVQRAVATAMQTSLLPPLPLVPGLALAARYVPAAEGLDVGGDWFDAFELGRGLAVVIGDTSGHDVDAAARMAALRHILRAHAIDRAESPAAVVGRLDRTADALALVATGTCVVGYLTKMQDAGWQLTWTSAGHLPPLVVRDGEARFLDAPPELMLGVDPLTERSDHQTVLRPGDLLVLYTDGLVELRDASLDDRLELLRQVAAVHADSHPDVLADALLTSMDAGGSDDVAVLLVRVLAA